MGLFMFSVTTQHWFAPVFAGQFSLCFNKVQVWFSIRVLNQFLPYGCKNQRSSFHSFFLINENCSRCQKIQCRVKALGWGHSQYKVSWIRQQLSQAPHFGNVPHPKAFTIVKHEAKFIMNQTYINHNMQEWEGHYAYSSRVGGKLCLLIGVRTCPLLRSKHNIPHIFQERN